MICLTDVWSKHHGNTNGPSGGHRESATVVLSPRSGGADRAPPEITRANASRAMKFKSKCAMRLLSTWAAPGPSHCVNRAHSKFIKIAEGING
jgi:hypothetical protein